MPDADRWMFRNYASVVSLSVDLEERRTNIDDLIRRKKSLHSSPLFLSIVIFSDQGMGQVCVNETDSISCLLSSFWLRRDWAETRRRRSRSERDGVDLFFQAEKNERQENEEKKWLVHCQSMCICLATMSIFFQLWSERSELREWMGVHANWGQEREEKRREEKRQRTFSNLLLDVIRACVFLVTCHCHYRFVLATATTRTLSVSSLSQIGSSPIAMKPLFLLSCTFTLLWPMSFPRFIFLSLCSASSLALFLKCEN